jgi:uncharacterized phage protein gp47/JayE
LSLLDDLKNGVIDIPTFLQQQNEKMVQTRLMSKVPDEYSKIQGGYMYDTITPNTYEFAMAYTAMQRLIQLIDPRATYGEFLKGLAWAFGVDKNEAQKANGELAVTGTPGLIIPSGTVFSTTIPLNSQTPPKYYVSTTNNTIPESGSVSIFVEAIEAGISGNVEANEINILSTKTLSGLTSITNPLPFGNGTPAETDEALRIRWFNRARNAPGSGNKRDYEIWSREVPGVDDIIIAPLWAGAGTVKLTVIPVGGVDPEIIRQNVKNYIDPYPEGEGNGKAPIGAVVTVVLGDFAEIDVRITDIAYADGVNAETAQTDVYSAVSAYLDSISMGGVVRLVKVEAAIGILDSVVAIGEVYLKTSVASDYIQDDIPLGVEFGAKLGEVVYE